MKDGFRRFFRLPGAITIVAFLVNEVLMVITPFHPIAWAVPYFPHRTVGIPILGLGEGMTLFAIVARHAIAARHGTLAALRRALLGIPVIGGIIWLSWHYDPRPLLEFLGR